MGTAVGQASSGGRIITCQALKTSAGTVAGRGNLVGAFGRYRYHFAVNNRGSLLEPIDNLIEGYRRFRQRYFHDEPELFASLVAQGQSPAVAVVACCDSRVDPAIIMDCEPGDLFTIRNVANLVPPYEPAHPLK